MKKFLATVIVLLLLCASGFLFGWAQMGVPPDSYGVIRSKSHGIDPQLVVPGEFRWVWYKLIPTNARMSVFRLAPVSRTVSASGTLPAADAYSRFTGIQGDFSWEIKAAFSFSFSPEALIPLVAATNIDTQEDLSRHENEIADQIRNLIINRMNHSEEFAMQIESLLINNESPAFAQEIMRQFPGISNFSFTVQSAKLPDFALYRMAKGLHEEFLAMQKAHIALGVDEMASNRAEVFNRIEELGLYGALLNEFPILIDYLQLELQRNNR